MSGATRVGFGPEVAERAAWPAGVGDPRTLSRWRQGSVLGSDRRDGRRSGPLMMRRQPSSTNIVAVFPSLLRTNRRRKGGPGSLRIRPRTGPLFQTPRQQVSGPSEGEARLELILRFATQAWERKPEQPPTE